jgi:uncharacterized protein
MLLMNDTVAPERTHLPKQHVTVLANEARAIQVRRGQLLRIEAGSPGVVASLFGFTEDPSVHLSVHHTRVFSNSYVLGKGMRLVTNRRRPLMVLGQDSVGHHDLLLPASPQVLDALKACAAEVGLSPDKWPDPINLFMNVELDQCGGLHPKPPRTQAGDHVTSRVLIDTTFIVCACPTDVEHHDQVGTLELTVAEDLSEF